VAGSVNVAVEPDSHQINEKTPRQCEVTEATHMGPRPPKEVPGQDPTIPETADLLEIRSMLEERGMEWWEQWEFEGVLEGRREGKLEGILVGEARLLHRLLERRFGSLPTWVEAHLAKGVEEDLVRWGERVLDPTLSLEQILTS
jgi:hypothetical protein